MLQLSTIVKNPKQQQQKNKYGCLRVSLSRYTRGQGM